MVGEIRALQEGQRRIVTLVPPAVAIGIPLVLRPSSEAPPWLAAAIFGGLSFMFLLLVATYIGYGLGTIRLSQYQMNHLAPRINSLAAPVLNDLFAWEAHVRAATYKTPFRIGAFALAHLSTLTMLYVPSLICAVVGLVLLSQAASAVVLSLALGAYVAMSVALVVFGMSAFEHAKRVHEA